MLSDLIQAEEKVQKPTFLQQKGEERIKHEENLKKVFKTSQELLKEIEDLKTIKKLF